MTHILQSCWALEALAWSSGISKPNSSSIAIITSTWSKESKPRSLIKCDSAVSFSAVILSKALQTVITLDSISALEVDAHLRDNSVLTLTRWRLLVFKHPGFAHKLFDAVCSKCRNLLVAYGIVRNEHVCNLPAIADRIKIEFSL